MSSVVMVTMHIMHSMHCDIDVMVSTAHVFIPFSKIVEDAEYGLWTVTLFRKKMEEFKTNAREKK